MLAVHVCMSKLNFDLTLTSCSFLSCCPAYIFVSTVKLLAGVNVSGLVINLSKFSDRHANNYWISSLSYLLMLQVTAGVDYISALSCI